MKKTDLAWLAGIFEGEGAITIAKFTKRNWGALRIRVTSTDRDMIDQLQDFFPGHIGTASSKPQHSKAWRWGLSSKKAKTFLLAIRPYCRVERVVEKIDLGLEFQAQKVNANEIRWDWNGKREEYRAIQGAYYLEMSDLNQRRRNGTSRV